jgi:hypothetical protein
MTQNDLRLAVHHDAAHPSKPWVLGIEVAPGKLQIIERYQTKVAADRVLKLLPTLHNHVPI